jgi:hypothetical protein
MHELAANTLAHTDGPGSLSVWATAGEVICQVQDAGHIADPLAGTLRRDRAPGAGGQGLWAVQQLCYLVEIRTGPGGSTIRLHMRFGSGPPRAEDLGAAASGIAVELAVQRALGIQVSELQKSADQRVSRADHRPLSVWQQPRSAEDRPGGGAVHDAHPGQVKDQPLRFFLHDLSQLLRDS